MLMYSFRFFAGKQHGSLARAGKVRGQTPKVEKQDKKKKKTGRAKRRIQYNRRFVNVVGGQARKNHENNSSPFMLYFSIASWLLASCYMLSCCRFSVLTYLCPLQFGGKKMSPNNIAVQQARAGVVADK
jgi:ribosomal protein S30